MNGFQITLFTQQDRKHDGKPLGEWLLHLVQEIHLRGATLLAGLEGVGRSGWIRSARFFELADQPLRVVIVATADEADQLFERLRAERVSVAYVKTPVEFGTVNEESE